jgi:hypothetical protein
MAISFDGSQRFDALRARLEGERGGVFLVAMSLIVAARRAGYPVAQAGAGG